MLNLTQQLIESPQFDLQTYSSARFFEKKLLSSLQAEGVNQSPYIPIPVSEALEESFNDSERMKNLSLFANDRGGIFQRIPADARAAVLQDVRDRGEVAAFLSVEQQHPEIFADPDFAPQGVDPQSWTPEKLVHGNSERRP
jgi:hypothetical protein